MHLERREDVFVLALDDGDNRFHRRFLDDMNRALDEVERSEGAAALVSTGQGKFYSNGLDLDWLGAQSAADAERFLDDLDRLFARVLTFPTATAAAINGHAFAAGLMLALAHDFRVMRADRGYACLPEIDLGIPLRPGMTATIQARLPQRIAHEAIVTGRRYGGADAEQRGIVDAAVPEADVLQHAIAMVAPLAGKDRATMRALKRGLYVQALEILERAR
jgi:enoyl-CoA hydratase/carnithine racemase